ncbi:hypothetical protein PG996_004303 [Apiospora saccharicola]|uniref:Centromere protein X n=1 Tax=Apiospora saccharicola TaxID=335842 RepID=A0ABR1W3S3_9PEZI
MSTNPYKAPRPRGRPAGSTAGSSTSQNTKAPAAKAKATLAKRPAQQRAAAQTNESDTDPFADSQQEASQDVMEVVDDDDEEDVDEEEDPPKTIPPELLTRILHTCFEKEGTRISKDANKAVAQYMDIFVRESIARVALEKEAGFLEVEDLEKVAPQLLLDL